MSQRVAVITGASRGIGKAAARALRRRGFATVELSSKSCDVRSEAAVKKAFASALKRHKRIDVLINCAGIVTFSSGLKVSKKEWDNVMATNLIGAYNCSKNALPIMARQKFGRIINVSSIAGRLYSRGASLAYTCSKYAVIGLTRQLAAEFGGQGVTVNCVAPSQTKTDMILGNFKPAEIKRMAKSNPLGRLAEPEEVANVIAFLAGDESSYVNGAVIDINGGLL